MSKGMAKRITNPLLAVAYIRASTDRQKNGPEAQRTAIAAWAAKNGVRIVSWREDLGVSGGTAIALRPGLVAALADMRAHRAGLFLADTRDRLGRDVLEVGLLEREVRKLGGAVRTADGKSDGGRLSNGVQDLFSENERDEIGRRIVAALANKRSKGEKTGGLVPYGYDAVDGETPDAPKRLVPNPAEQDTLKLVRELRATGMSTRKIAAELAARGVHGRKGPLHNTQIVRMLERAA